AVRVAEIVAVDGAVARDLRRMPVDPTRCDGIDVVQSGVEAGLRRAHGDTDARRVHVVRNDGEVRVVRIQRPGRVHPDALRRAGDVARDGAADRLDGALTQAVEHAELVADRRAHRLGEVVARR